jgi:hypothetical protein
MTGRSKVVLKWHIFIEKSYKATYEIEIFTYLRLTKNI